MSVSEDIQIKRLNPGLLDVHLKIEQGQVKQIFTYDVDSWWMTLFELKGRTWPWRPWVIVMTETFVLILIDDKYPFKILGNEVFDRSVNTRVHATFGIILSFLIIHISKQSCQRWWEARVAWENIITNARDATRLLCCHCNGKEIIKLFGKYLIAFTITTKHYLNNKKYNTKRADRELEKILPPADMDRLKRLSLRKRPVACLYVCQRITELSIKQNLFSRPIARDINPRFIALSHLLGVCERIRFTPIPWVYNIHTKFVLVFFLLLTPLAMFHEDPLPSIGQIVIFMGILSYAFLGLEDLASKVQNPFGENPSHLPLDIFVHMAYRDVKDVIALKYESFGKEYSDRLYRLGRYEIEWKKKNANTSEEEVMEDDADD